MFPTYVNSSQNFAHFFAHRDQERSRGEDLSTGLPTTTTSYTKSRKRPPEIPKVSQASTEIRNGDCQPRCQLAVNLKLLFSISYIHIVVTILIVLLGQPNGSKIQNSASILGTHIYVLLQHTLYTHISFPPLCFLYSVDSFYRNKKLKELVEGGTHIV